MAIAEAVTDLVGEPIAATGVDGCGAPRYGLTLTGLARAFARLVTAEPGSPERRVADAMRAIVTGPTVKGEMSTRLTAVLPEPYLRSCVPCSSHFAISSSA